MDQKVSWRAANRLDRVADWGPFVCLRWELPKDRGQLERASWTPAAGDANLRGQPRFYWGRDAHRRRVGQLAGQGVTRETFKAGDVVIITGNPGRNPASSNPQDFSVTPASALG
jgi:hypothetical protein